MQQSTQPFAMIVKRSFVNAIPKIWFKAVFTLANFWTKMPTTATVTALASHTLGKAAQIKWFLLALQSPR